MKMVLFVMLVAVLTGCKNLKCSNHQFSTGTPLYEPNETEASQISDAWVSWLEQEQGW